MCLTVWGGLSEDRCVMSPPGVLAADSYAEGQPPPRQLPVAQAATPGPAKMALTGATPSPGGWRVWPQVLHPRPHAPLI